MKGKLISPDIQRTKYVICDLVMTAVAFFVFNIYRFVLLKLGVMSKFTLSGYLESPKIVAEQCIIPVVMLGIYWMSGYYNRPFDKSRLQEFITTLFSALIGSLFIYFALLTNDQVARSVTNYEMIGTLFMLLLFFVYSGRLSITQHALNKFSAHRWCINTLMIGNSRVAHETAYKLARSTSRLGYNIVGFVNIDGEEKYPRDKDVYEMKDVPEICRSKKVDQLLITPDSNDENKVLNMLYNLFPLNVPIKITPDTLSYLTSGIRLQDIYGEPFVDLTSPAVSESAKNVKRMIDVILSLVVLVLLSPLYAVLSILVKHSSKGPVIYSQERVGYRHKPFKIYKFRTMYEDAEKDGPRLSADGDPRITPLGKVMRKYRLDEIPQFWNVLKGDMSLVGPRPEREFFIRQIVRKAPYYTLVSQVRPGITSWGMVKYGYASSVEEMVERTRYDLIYLANMSTLVDFKILIYTVKTVLTGRGI